MSTVKVYLDHKDYVRITSGLRGSPNCREDMETYEILNELVHKGKITIYFSWVHVCEALKYDGTDSEIQERYCDVIETLTRGNCLIGPLDIRKRELEFFFAKEFGFPTQLIRESIAYGKYSDALFVEPFIIEENPLEMFKESVLKNARNRRERKQFIKILADPVKRRKLLQQQMSGSLDNMKRTFPLSEAFYDNESLMKLFDGDDQIKCIKSKQLMDGVCTFKNLLNHYGHRDPELKRFASSFDAYASELIPKIKHAQAIYQVTGEYLIEEKQMEEDLITRFSEKLSEETLCLSKKFGFPIGEAIERLRTSKLRGIPSLGVVVTIFVEYLKKHKGNLEQGRPPSESDLRDLFHASHIPYVDYYLTDRFFSAVDQKGGKLYSTQILKSLTQLRPHLESL